MVKLNRQDSEIYREVEFNSIAPSSNTLRHFRNCENVRIYSALKSSYLHS